MQEQKRPYVICHMVASLDGKIDGEFFSAPQAAASLTASEQIRKLYECGAVIYGSITMARTFADGFAGRLPAASEHFERAPCLAQHDTQPFFVAVDPAGTVRYASSTVERRGRPKAHIVAALCENVADAYLAHLREAGVSYFFVGKEKLDCALLLHFLSETMGVERALLCGGGVVNWTFLQAGLIDELNLVIGPVADGGQSASVFDSSPFTQGAPVAFKLEQARTLPGDALWLTYKPQQSNSR